MSLRIPSVHEMLEARKFQRDRNPNGSRMDVSDWLAKMKKDYVAVDNITRKWLEARRHVREGSDDLFLLIKYLEDDDLIMMIRKLADVVDDLPAYISDNKISQKWRE